MVGGDFIADDDNAADVGFFGPAGGDLTVNQTVIDARRPIFMWSFGPSGA